MEAKDRTDSRLKTYIHNSINSISPNIDSVFFPILEEIILRRALLHGLSKVKVSEDIKTLKNWMQRIDIENIQFANGLFYSQERRIALDVDYLQGCLDKRNYEEIFRLIAHEVTHALCTDEDGCDILAVSHDGRKKTFFDRIIKRLDNSKHNSLLELIVSELSERMIFCRKKDPNSSIYYSQTKSYSKSAEILELIEASYGVSEKELLDHAILGRREMARFLASKSGRQTDEVLDDLDMFEIQYTCLHKSIYYSDESVEGLAFINNIANLYSLCAKTMSDRMRNIDINSTEQARALCERLKFDYNKLSYLIDSFVSKSHCNEIRVSTPYGINEPGDNLLQRFFNECEYPLANKILKMESVLKAKDDGRNQDELLMAFNTIRHTPLEDIEMLGSMPNEEEAFLFDIDSETLERYKEDDVEWDNEELLSYIEREFGPIVEQARIQEVKNEKSDSDGEKKTIKGFLNAIKKAFKPIVNGFKERLSFLFGVNHQQLPEPKNNMSFRANRETFLEEVRFDGDNSICTKDMEYNGNRIRRKNNRDKQI